MAQREGGGARNPSPPSVPLLTTTTSERIEISLLLYSTLLHKKIYISIFILGLQAINSQFKYHLILSA